MKLAVLGVGGAGGRLAARLAAADPDDRPSVAAVAAFDTDPEALADLDLPREHRHAFGTTARSADATAVRTAAEGNARELSRSATDAVPAA
ncbi:cell division protein FtsZ, partial [Halolamina salifodinae]